MTITLNGTTGITNDGGYTGDGIIFANTTPSNTLVTTTGGNVGIGNSSPSYRLDITEVASPTTTPTVRVGNQRNIFFQPGLGGFGVYGPAIGLGAHLDTSNSPPLLVMQAGRLMNGGSAIAGTGEGQIEFYAYRDAVYNAAVTVNANNVLRARIDNNGDFLFNSGYGSAAIAYGCRAWVNFNGTGTVAIRASGNVSSITDLGTGYYRVNFTTAMPDINYAAAQGPVAIGDGVGSLQFQGRAVGSYDVRTRYSDGGSYDWTNIDLAFFR